jgi:hypothetical protein
MAEVDFYDILIIGSKYIYIYPTLLKTNSTLVHFGMPLRR